MSNQEMQFADPDWKPSQQLDPHNNQQEKEEYTPQPINDAYREQRKWGSAPSSSSQQEGYTGSHPYTGPVPGQMQGGNYRQRPYSRRGRGPWFWIILAFIVISLISGGSRFNNGFGPRDGDNPFNKQQVVTQNYDYTVNGQATIVINDPNGNITVTQGQSSTDVSIQPIGGNSFPGNPNDIQQSISKTDNTITANIQNSVDLQVTVPNGANLSLNTGSGNINVSGVDGQMKLVTNDGTINASNDALSGSSGLTTNSGDINFDGTINTGGNYQFITTSGKVTVAMPSSPAFHLDASTNSGSMHSDFPNVNIQDNTAGQSVNGVVGGSSQSKVPNVVIRSDNGDINLNQK